MNTGNDDFLMMLGERACLGHDLIGGPAAVVAARQRRRAERAMLIAAVLDAQQSADAGLRRRANERCVTWKTQRRGERRQVRAGNKPLHRRQAAQRQSAASIGEGAGAAHDHAPQAGTRFRRAAHGLSEIRLGLGGYRTAVEDGDVRLRRVGDDGVTCSLDHRASRLGVVMISPTPERPEIHPHPTASCSAAERRAGHPHDTLGWF